MRTYAYFYCGEDNMPGSDKPSFTRNCIGDKVAYTWNDLGTFWSAHYVVLCPKFFSSSMIHLDHLVDIADGNPSMQGMIDSWQQVRGLTIFHETYHWKDTVSKPRCLDYAYNAGRITKLAANEPGKAVKNAESYALAAAT